MGVSALLAVMDHLLHVKSTVDRLGYKFFEICVLDLDIILPFFHRVKHSFRGNLGKLANTLQIDESVTPSPSSTEASETPQSTITSGSKTTSAPVAHTFTRTLPDGGTTTLTSTSWVAVLPTNHADGSKNPDLQNAASLPRAEMMMPAAIGLLVGAVLLA